MPDKTRVLFDLEGGEPNYFDYYGEAREQFSPSGDVQRRPRREWVPNITDDWPGEVPVFVEELELYEQYFSDALDQMLGIRPERIWRREGLKVPQKQPKRGRLWLNDGSCIRLRPEYPGHVWSYDFVEGRTHDGRKFRILSIIDEASRECLALPVARRLRSEDVLAALAELFVTRGPPAHIRSDNGPEFIANAVQQWLAKIGVKKLYITPGSPWENGYCESFNGSMRDELLNGEIFYTLAEAQILIEAWRRHYNTVRPHSSLGYRPPAPETATPPWLPSGSATLHLRSAMAPETVLHFQSIRTTQGGAGQIPKKE